MTTEGQGAFVSWADFMGRSQGFIDNLDMIPIYLKRTSSKSKVLLPLRYLMNFFQTIHRLHKAKPNLVIVMCPPIFAAVSVAIFGLLTGTKFIVDIHSGAFESKKWRWSIPFLRSICRQANLVFVTNIVHAKEVEKWGAKPMILGDPPPVIPQFAEGYLSKLNLVSPAIIVINSYSKNEALEEIIDAARLCTDVTFYITGDKRKADEKTLNGSPANVVLTGWLENDDYWWSLKKCNAILTLIEQENTILRGGWEAMYLGQPLITSNTTALSNYFHKGTVFVDNYGTSISEGIRYALKNEVELRAAMEDLKRERIREWDENMKTITRITSSASH